MAEQVVELVPGESKEVAFEAVPIVAGAYQVSVNGLTGTFTALDVSEAKLVYISVIRHYSQKVYCDPPWGGSTNYLVFEVDVQNQGGVGANCSAIASCRYLVDEWSDWLPFRYEQYARNNALALKVDSAYINPGQIVTFREALWPYAYEDAGARRIQSKFIGDAGEIVSEIIRI